MPNDDELNALRDSLLCCCTGYNADESIRAVTSTLATLIIGCTRDQTAAHDALNRLIAAIGHIETSPDERGSRSSPRPAGPAPAGNLADDRRRLTGDRRAAGRTRRWSLAWGLGLLRWGGRGLRRLSSRNLGLLLRGLLLIHLRLLRPLGRLGELAGRVLGVLGGHHAGRVAVKVDPRRAGFIALR
jgi:hypothetical protein